MRKFIFTHKYLLYLIQSKTKHDIHSPFIFTLLTQVIQKKNKKIFEHNETLNKTKKLSDREKKYIWFASNTSKYSQLVFRLIKNFKAKHIVEIGTSTGINTSYLAITDRENKIYTLEKNKKTSSKAINAFKTLGLNNIKLFDGNISDNLDIVTQEIKHIDFLHITDNDNSKQTYYYFEKCLKYIHNDSVFIFNDIHETKDNEKIWIKIKNNPKVKVSIDLFFIGIVFFKRELTKENFMIRF